MSSKVQTLNQQRAEFALKCVKRIKLLNLGRWFFIDGEEKFGIKIEKEEDFKLSDIFKVHDIRKFASKYGSFWIEIWKDLAEKIIKDTKEKVKNELEKKGIGEDKKNLLLKVYQNYIENPGIKEEDFKKELESKGFSEEVYYLLLEYVKKKFDDKFNHYKNYITNLSFDYSSNYSSHAKRLPQLIVSNGLIPTLAFYKSKGEDRRQIYNDIELWLKFGANNGNGIISNKGEDLLKYLLEIDSSQLRLATMEALEFSNWLKRICEIELKEEGGKE